MPKKGSSSSPGPSMPPLTRPWAEEPAAPNRPRAGNWRRGQAPHLKHLPAPSPPLDAITQKRDVANIRSAASSSDNLAKHRLLLRKTIALSAAEIPRFGVLASTHDRDCQRLRAGRLPDPGCLFIPTDKSKALQAIGEVVSIAPMPTIATTGILLRRNTVGSTYRGLEWFGGLLDFQHLEQQGSASIELRHRARWRI